MGQMQSATNSTFYTSGQTPANSSNGPLKFNTKFGENCAIYRDGSVAKRTESFCKGILFSDRPVECGERVCIRLTELSIRWSGVLRLGFTSHNPQTLQSLPKYACPDLTCKPGYWAKALTERYAESNALIYYYYTAHGDVYFGVNGYEKGLFFSGVDTRHPLWCLIDLYGNCTAIELVDMRRILNNYSRGDEDGEGEEVEEENVEAEANAPAQSNHDNLINDLDDLSLDPNSNEPDAPLLFNSSFTFRPLKFHESTGPNVSLNGSSTIAWRHNDEYSNGYVFVNEPIRHDERIVVQILATENMYMGSLAFGLTSVDPSTLDPDSLPEDSDMLLDRPEYWVVSKDVANSPDEGDELSFCVKEDGAVQFSKNGNVPSVFMHVDNNIDLWAFWDVYGNTQKLRLVGSTKDPVIRPDQLRQNSNASLENDRNNLSMSDLLQGSTPDPLFDSGRLSGLPPIPPPRRSQSSHALPPPPVPRPSQQPSRQEPGSATSCAAALADVADIPAAAPSSSAGESSSSTNNRNTDSRNGTDECKICYENIVDCVLYACGHMCLCYECALQQWKGRGGGICPMCRNYIQDVIKIYKS
eukprot:TRINITY_DN3840_c0_g1_i2.p1 TRINITY_DN3840_c0_g1~~TRINITY_DN3840_c0_g1_i2.p1  ORF type:complete len:584 (-),score=123.24 TRINITY_DN3840_c0_g1_i2:374-2125(-)